MIDRKVKDKEEKNGAGAVLKNVTAPQHIFESIYIWNEEEYPLQEKFVDKKIERKQKRKEKEERMEPEPS